MISIFFSDIDDVTSDILHLDIWYDDFIYLFFFNF